MAGRGIVASDRILSGSRVFEVKAVVDAPFSLKRNYHAGALRDIITVQEKASGAWRDKWTNIPADIQPLTGRERWQAEQAASQVDQIIVTRWIEGSDGPSEWIKVQCTEVFA
jgi:head-tail adaptor